MDPALMDAAIRGDVPYLTSLLSQNPMLLETFLLHTPTGAPPPTTLLHIASLHGRTAFAMELVRRKPELAKVKDSQGLLPIHRSAARGHSGLVVEMLRFNPYLGNKADNDGRKVVHLAAACGSIEVIREILNFHADLSLEVSERYQETMLHTSVLHGHLDATRFICDTCSHLVCRKDSFGNTALHIAALKRNAPIVNYLLKDTNAEINAENEEGYTALDLALRSDMAHVDRNFCQMMVYAGARRGQGRTKKSTDGKKESWLISDEERKIREKAGFKDVQNTMLIVATVIVGVTFQSGLEHATGSTLFRLFNAVSMGTSVVLILLLASGATLKHWITTRLLLLLLWVSLASMALAYGAFIFHKDGQRKNRSKIATGFLACIIILLLLVLMGHLGVLVVRIGKNLVRKRNKDQLIALELANLPISERSGAPLICNAAK